MKQKIIATGLSGLVGSRIRELLGEKYEFINFSLDKGVDITDFGLLKSKFAQFSQAKTVLHLAAFTDVSRAWEQNGDKKGSCYRVNVLGSKNVARLCKKRKMLLIDISTDFVFNGKDTPVGGYTEEDVPQPIEWYGQTKLWAEQEVEKSGCDFSILRLAFPFKAKPSLKQFEPVAKLDLVRKLISKLKKGEKLAMFTDQIITPTFIDDIVQVIEKVIEKRAEGLFHCVGSTSLSPYDLAMEIANVFDFDKALIKQSTLRDYLKANPGTRPRQKNSALANLKLTRELGVKMKTLAQALRVIKDQGVGF